MPKKIKKIKKIADLVPDFRNANKGTERGRGMVEHSLRQYGAGRSILADKDGNVIAGNKTLEAAADIGLPIRVIETDGKELVVVQRKDLDLTQPGSTARQLAYADNRASEVSMSWDVDVLRQDLADGEDLSAFFHPDELAALMAAAEAPVEGNTDPDAVPQERATDIVAGDLFQLGRHRLLCGDSTSGEAVARLMGTAKARLVFADPPYGYSYQSNQRTKSAKFAVLENDDRILDGFLTHLDAVSQGWVMVCSSWKVILQWVQACAVVGEMSNLIVWDKGGGGMGDLEHTFSTDYELILAFNRGETIKGKRLGSVWSIGKDAAGSYEHATQKPVALAAQAIESCTAKGDVIYDPFCGSGTVTIASEQYGRTCHAMELTPSYAQVAIDRWEAFTNQKAIKLGAAVPA